MKLGIIGAGKIVGEFLPQILAVPDITVTALLCRNLNKEGVKALAEQLPPEALLTTDFEALCAVADTVYVAVPNAAHYDYCRRALARGLHVIAEKPMAATYAQAAALAALAEQQHCFLFEAVTTRHLGNYKKIREWLPKIGRLKLVQCCYSQYSSRYDAFRQGEVLPAFSPAHAGGALMDLNLYNLHFVLGLLGAPAAQTYYPNLERNIDTSGVLVMEYPGFVAVCTAAKDCAGEQSGILQGEDGCIRYEKPANLVGRVALELRGQPTQYYDDGADTARAVPEFTAFAAAIAHGDWAFCQENLEASLGVSRVLTEARLGAGVRFPMDEDA